MYKSLYSRLKRIGLKNILIFLTIFFEILYVHFAAELPQKYFGGNPV